MTDIDIKEFMYSSFKNMDDRIKELTVSMKENTALTEKVLLQATQTNGRVTALEDRTNDYQDTKARVAWIIGVGAATVALCGVVYALTVQSIHNQITKEISECCSQKKTDSSTTYTNNVSVK